MANVPGARGREADELKDEGADADLLFPSEGTFSAVVPLSEVRAGRDSARGSAALVAAPSVQKESNESKEPEEETTLVPARAGRARRVSSKGRESRRWLAMTAAVALSVVAGLAAGAYMVWTQQTRLANSQATPAAVTSAPNADAPAQQQAAPVAAPHAPAPAEAEVAESEAEVVKAEPVERPVASADETKPAAATTKAGARASAETASRRDAGVAEPRASARERARGTAADSTPAPKPAPRRQTTTERARANATASRGRALPVSSPPPSARPRTVIQWP